MLVIWEKYFAPNAKSSLFTEAEKTQFPELNNVLKDLESKLKLGLPPLGIFKVILQSFLLFLNSKLLGCDFIYLLY